MNNEAQIQALLTGKALQFACATLGVSHMARRSYREAFTVSRADVDAYVALHGIPLDLVTTHTSSGEGLHFVRSGSRWSLYWQEGGQHYDEQTFDDEPTAKKALLDWILGISGTGIDFTR